MFCSILTIHTDVIMHGDDPWEPIGDLVHPNLKYILRHFKTKRHAEEPIASFMCIKGGEVGRLCVKVVAPEVILCI